MFLAVLPAIQHDLTSGGKKRMKTMKHYSMRKEEENNTKNPVSQSHKVT